VTNDNDVTITVRVVYVVWEEKSDDYMQGFYLGHPTGDLITVPARGSAVVDLQGEALAMNLQHGPTKPTSFEAFFAL
jgi:hypothetical protein